MPPARLPVVAARIRRSAWPRWVLLTAAILLMSGCVYYRLYKFKGQLGEFSDYLGIENRPRPYLVFSKPVLKARDVGWLVGLKPSATSIRRGDGTSHFRFHKRQAEAAVAHAGDLLAFEQVMVDGRLVEFGFPEHFAPFLTQQNFMEVFLPIREALVNRGDFRTEWSWANMNIRIPDRATIYRFMGPPTSMAHDAGIDCWQYLYDLDKPDNTSVPPSAQPELRVQCSFWPELDKLMIIEFTVGKMWVQSDLASEDKMVKMRRD